jgi:hypothetical protein
VKLYRSTNYPTRWYAFGPEIGWVMFPAEAGGWEKRQPARALDPLDVREVPLRLAFNTGILDTHTPAEAALDVPFPEAA